MVDCLNHKSPWPCEPGWRVQPTCPSDSGERWHSDIGYCELASCILGVLRMAPWDFEYI
jgi:hypothetical protein